MPELDDDNITNIPIYSPYKEVPVNGTFRLYNGLLHIKGLEPETYGEGYIEVAIYGKPQIRFHLTTTPSVRFGGRDVTLQTSAFKDFDVSSCLAFITRSHYTKYEATMDGILGEEGLITRQLKLDGNQEPVGRMRFHLINFKTYWGATLSQPDGDVVHSWGGRTTFPVGNYVITIDTLYNADARLKEAYSINGYGFTHVGSMRRADNKLFDPEKGAEVLECLGWFFSFANGSYCPCVLQSGFRYLDQPLWQQWNMPHLSVSDNYPNWFMAIRSWDCFAAANSFYECWQNTTKRQWLKTAMELYLASNRLSDSVELALANSQIPLEMLTWVALMEENFLMSEDSFNKLPAADKIRALSFWLGVPTAVPHRLKELRQAMPGVDLPKAIVDLRNLLIHQTRANRESYAKVPPAAVFQAWQVNLWYIELTLLKLIGYSGHYYNRIGKPSEMTHDVLPWVK